MYSLGLVQMNQSAVVKTHLSSIKDSRSLDVYSNENTTDCFFIIYSAVYFQCVFSAPEVRL